MSVSERHLLLLPFACPSVQKQKQAQRVSGIHNIIRYHDNKLLLNGLIA